MLSKYQLIISDFAISNAKKLVPDFFHREKYVLHYENLLLYLKIGLKLKQIHCALEFNQSQWLKPYAKFNTQNRSRKNGDKDGKALYKLMNNAAYGKTIENHRKRIDVKLAKQWRRLLEVDIKTKLHVIKNIAQ